MIKNQLPINRILFCSVIIIFLIVLAIYSHIDFKGAAFPYRFLIKSSVIPFCILIYILHNLFLNILHYPPIIFFKTSS